MRSELEALKISHQEVEELSGLDVTDLSVGGIYRPHIWQHSKRFISFFVTELALFSLIFIFAFAIALVLLRNFTNISSGVYSLIQLCQLAFTISLLTFLGRMAYQWSRRKRVLVLTKLLDEIDRYNDVIHAIAILEKLEAVGNLPLSSSDRENILDAMQATRVSLVSALMTERILREHQPFLTRRYELFTNIENHLLALNAIAITDQASEYGQLLNEALQIGKSVYQEIKKLPKSN